MMQKQGRQAAAAGTAAVQRWAERQTRSRPTASTGAKARQTPKSWVFATELP